jgi:RimJ/RimL family protein N-acetyltransferase
MTTTDRPVATTLAMKVADVLAAFPKDIQPDERLRSAMAHGTLVAMRRIVGAAYPTVAPEAIRLCDTWGDLLELVEPHDARDFRLPAGDIASGSGFTVRLRPLRPDDTPALYEAAMDPGSGFRWRYRGRTMSIDQFHQTLHDGVLAQFMVETLDGAAPIGLCVAYNHVSDGGHCHIAFQRVQTDAGQGGEMIEGLFLFLGHVFRSFPLRRVFFEIPEYNQYLVPGAHGLLEPEGRLREYFFHDGRYWDQLNYSVDVDRFKEFEEGFYRSSGGS